MAKYRVRNPDPADAWQFDPAAPIPLWVVQRWHNLGDGKLTCGASVGRKVAEPGDWIVSVGGGMTAAMTAAEFEETFEPVPGSTQSASPAEGEDNWTMCQRLAREVDKDILIQRLLQHVARTRPRNKRSLPFWSFVRDATANGSGVSSAICALYGVHPDTGESLATARKEGER